jgi:hypothetical protein
MSPNAANFTESGLFGSVTVPAQRRGDDIPDEIHDQPGFHVQQEQVTIEKPILEPLRQRLKLQQQPRRDDAQGQTVGIRVVHAQHEGRRDLLQRGEQVLHVARGQVLADDADELRGDSRGEDVAFLRRRTRGPDGSRQADTTRLDLLGGGLASQLRQRFHRLAPQRHVGLYPVVELLDGDRLRIRRRLTGLATRDCHGRPQRHQAGHAQSRGGTTHASAFWSGSAGTCGRRQ